MNDYLCDTNHLSTIVTPGHPVGERIARQIRYGDTFAVPAPVLTETLYGILTLSRAKENFKEWQRSSVMFTYYRVEREDAEDAAHLQVSLRKQGEQLETVDAIIAIIASRYDLILLTTDHDFDAVEGLETENWFE